MLARWLTDCWYLAYKISCWLLAKQIKLWCWVTNRTASNIVFVSCKDRGDWYSTTSVNEKECGRYWLSGLSHDRPGNSRQSCGPITGLACPRVYHTRPDSKSLLMSNFLWKNCYWDIHRACLERLVISLIYLVFNLSWLAFYNPIISYLLRKNTNKGGTLGYLQLQEHWYM